MKKLLVAVLVTFIIAACGITGDDGSGRSYPFTEQTWEVQSSTDADWIGVSGLGKVKGHTTSDHDTTFINQPNEYGLEITEHDAIEDRYILSFNDSTYSSTNPPGGSRVDSLFGYHNATINTEYFADYTRVNIHYPFECTADPEPVDTLNMIYTSDEDTTDHYQVVISGALEAVTHIKCDD